MELRDVTAADRPDILALNQASVQMLSDLDEQRLRYILALAHRSLAVEHEGVLVAFAVAIAPGADYDSLNYRWFVERFERFLYLDRIAVTTELRRAGIGARLYDAMEAAAAPFGRMVCDVNDMPPNDASLAFHAVRGYEQVGRLEHSPAKAVAMLSKELERADRGPQPG